MTGGTILAYLGVVALITITPGPDTALVLRNAMRHGWSAGVRTGVGSAVGLLIWGLAASLGIAMILAASALAFSVLKLAGAAYLGYLGVRMLWQAWRHRTNAETLPADGQRPAVSAGKLFRQGLTTNLLNPKAGAFFTAVIPQFVSAHGLAAAPLVIGLALIAAAANLSGQCVFAVAAHRTARLVGRRAFERILDSVVGVVLLALGGKLAFSDRA
ncbi:LysE family translocator [Actinomadura darangshiensis]|uniref:LysE family translocator n=1 Tax=Actinomadura darangshiensis TaxID=705336 RepID=A0A4R5B5P5_9ACTN|nr:LysE family translocator [Actinomadura darangshiensis]TDD80323.1 LysE family translocator [Actinomadura darangshiensis]